MGEEQLTTVALFVESRKWCKEGLKIVKLCKNCKTLQYFINRHLTNNSVKLQQTYCINMALILTIFIHLSTFKLAQVVEVNFQKNMLPKTKLDGLTWMWTKEYENHNHLCNRFILQHKIKNCLISTKLQEKSLKLHHHKS